MSRQAQAIKTSNDITPSDGVGYRSAPSRQSSFPLARIATWVVVICTVIAGNPAAARQEEDTLFVRKVSFTGNRHVSDESLRFAIATTQSSTFARHPLLRWMGLGEKRTLQERELRRDVLRIKAYYGASGYPHAIVDTTLSRNGRDLTVRFHITEHEPVVVKTLVVQGVDGIMTESVWARALPLSVGAPFAKLLLQPSVNILSALARDRGYPYAEASASFQEDSAGNADVLLTLLPGIRVTIDSVEVEGVTKIEPDVIRRIVNVRSGQPYSAQRMYESQLALHRLGFFRSIEMRLQETPESQFDSTATAVVQLSETSFQRTKLSAGYGTLDCMRTLASWEVFDFLGGGRTLQLSGRLSQLGAGRPFNAGFEHSICPALRNESDDRLRTNYHLNASLSDPFFFFNRARATLSLFVERATEFQAYIRESVGGEVSTAGRLRGQIPVTFAYSLSSGRTLADPVTFCSFLNVCRVQDTEVFTQRRRRAAMALELTKSTTNAALDANSGTRTSLGLRWASPLIGSDSLFHLARIEFEIATYRRLGRAVFAGRAIVGTIFAPEVNLPTGRERFVSPGERFYSGGPNSVRGFSQNQLGPQVKVIQEIRTDNLGRTDSIIRTSAVGGDGLVVLNAELRIPLTTDGVIATGIFVDAGRVTRRTDEGVGLVATPGVGIRIQSPIGPVRFDIGYNPQRESTSPLFARSGDELVTVDPAYRTTSSFFERLRFHFAVGQAF